MSTEQRNPRANPKPGDVLEDTDGSTYEVLITAEGFVRYQKTSRWSVSASRWMEITSHARVIKRGGSDA